MVKIVIDVPLRMLQDDGNEIILRIGKKADGTVCINGVVNAQACADAPATAEVEEPVWLCEYMDKLIAKFRDEGKWRIQETYASAKNSIMRFTHGHDVDMRKMTKDMMIDYERRMRSLGLSLNTTSFYMRILRACYNRAVRNGEVTDVKPFELVFTGACRTVKRATTLRVIKKIQRAKLTSEADILARDMFFFSYFTRGMSFVDIAHLKRDDIKNGYLTYRRQKTGKKMKIAWRQEMQDIVNKHPSIDGEHLLGLLDGNGDNLRRQYHTRQCCINDGLKRIAKRLKLNMNLTMYVARHSWATIARDMNVPISIISDGMGHNSESTTRIYLKSIDAQQIDKMNDMMIKAV